jgi:hypothetical protein
MDKAVLAEANGECWKFAVLNVVQAIELSLKELLRREHWSLIFRKVDDHSRTVTIDEALRRLHFISSFQLSQEESKALKFAQDIRNDIVHHKFELEPNEVKLAFAQLFGFLVDFHRGRLDYSIERCLSKSTWKEAVAIREYRAVLLTRALERIENDTEFDSEDILTCPACNYATYVRTEYEEAKCYVCEHTEYICICNGCKKPFLEEQTDHEACGRNYCSLDCLSYYTDDYWYEVSVGK